MALPTGNLTFHVDASVNTDLWRNNSGGSFSTHPADGEETEFWDDVEHTANHAGVIANGPAWRSGTPVMSLPCLDFNGSDNSYRINDDVAGTPKALSNIITNSAFTLFASIYIEGIGTNAAASYDNDAIFSDSGGFWGVHVKNSADPRIQFFNWDGNEDVVSLVASLNTSYVIMYRHEGGNIYASLNGGSETSVASGNTTDLTGAPRIGQNFAASNKFFNGRVGEVAIYNAALSGSTLTDALSYFTGRWLAASPVPQGALALAGTSSGLRYQINMPDEA